MLYRNLKDSIITHAHIIPAMKLCTWACELIKFGMTVLLSDWYIGERKVID
jgi:hypothetical protein